jgi:hypothetical protein
MIITQKQLLLLGFAPYLGLALYDGWLHEKARRVPMREQLLHASVFVALVALWTGLFFKPVLVWPALALFATAAFFDEFGYHGMLEARERRLHFAAYACFAGFVAWAAWLHALPGPPWS